MGFFFIARGLYIHERSILAGKLLYSYRITSSINVVDTIIGNIRHLYYLISFIVGSIQITLFFIVSEEVIHSLVRFNLEYNGFQVRGRDIELHRTIQWGTE